MKFSDLGRRVAAPARRDREYVRRDSRKSKRRRSPCQERRRHRPSSRFKTIQRSYTLSVPAQEHHNTPAHQPIRAGVTQPDLNRDPAAMIAAAAQNSAVSDRALRVYIVATAYDRGVSAAQVAATLTGLTEPQAARLLGDLVSAGLLVKRLRTVGYTDGRRIRRGLYTLAGGDA